MRSHCRTYQQCITVPPHERTRITGDSCDTATQGTARPSVRCNTAQALYPRHRENLQPHRSPTSICELLFRILEGRARTVNTRAITPLIEFGGSLRTRSRQSRSKRGASRKRWLTATTGCKACARGSPKLVTSPRSVTCDSGLMAVTSCCTLGSFSNIRAGSAGSSVHHPTRRGWASSRVATRACLSPVTTFSS